MSVVEHVAQVVALDVGKARTPPLAGLVVVHRADRHEQRQVRAAVQCLVEGILVEARGRHGVLHVDAQKVVPEAKYLTPHVRHAGRNGEFRDGRTFEVVAPDSLQRRG